MLVLVARFRLLLNEAESSLLGIPCTLKPPWLALSVRADRCLCMVCPNRDRCPKVCVGEFWTTDANLEFPEEYRPTWRQYCTTPGAKFRQFRPTLTHQPVSHKRLGAGAWGEIRRILPHVKKEKNLSGAKSPTRNSSETVIDSAASDRGPSSADAQAPRAAEVQACLHWA